ncbi:hypothetical protein K8S19_02660 [bacterium]|nr:hypothetical protein [bacterium]
MRRAYHQARNLDVYRGNWKKAILALKQYPNPEMVRQLAKWCIQQRESMQYTLVWSQVTVVPSRQKETTGIERVARCIAKRLGIIFSPVLKFSCHTVSQHTLDRTARLHNIRGSIATKRKTMITGNWLVIDDVYTTGATVNECARILRKSGAQNVDVLTLARGLDRRVGEPGGRHV